MSFNELHAKAKQHYPNSRAMQRKWVIHTFRLYAQGRHALITGGWKNGANDEPATIL